MTRSPEPSAFETKSVACVGPRRSMRVRSAARQENEGSTTHLCSLYEAIRVQRNDAVHQMNAAVPEGSVRYLIQSFPYALGKTEEIRTWLVPGTI